VHALISYKTNLSNEFFITYFTAIQLTSMYACMLYQIILVTECLITHITHIRALTTVCAFMCCNTALVIESLITHTTNIRALTSMYVLMSFQMGLLTE